MAIHLHTRAARPASARFTAIMLMLGLASCGGGEGIGPGDEDAVATVTISPDGLTLLVGATASLSADVRDTAGASMASTDVVWTSRSTTVATVSNSGTVTGVAVGLTQVIAAVGGKADTVGVVVTGPGGLPPNLILRVNSRVTRTIVAGEMESFEGAQVVSDIQLTFDGVAYVGVGPLEFGGSGFEYRPFLAPCTVWSQATAPGPVTASARLEPGSTVADLSLLLTEEQPGTATQGSGTLSAGEGCPPLPPQTVDLPNQFFALFGFFHPGPIQGWQPGSGQPFATYSTASTRDELGATLTENTTLELYEATP